MQREFSTHYVGRQLSGRTLFSSIIIEGVVASWQRIRKRVSPHQLDNVNHISLRPTGP